VSEATRASVGRALGAILRITLAGCAIAIAANAVAGLWRTVAGLAVAVSVFLIALLLHGRGLTRPAGVLTLFAIIGTVQVLVAVGFGIHDLAVLLYPVAIVVSTLLLDRRLVALSTALTLASSLGTLFAEDMGFLVTRGAGCLGEIGIEHYVDVAVILVATAVIAHLVVEGMVQAVDAARHSEARLAESNAELEAKNVELVRFTYAVSHDLKSPLVTIRGFLGYIEEHARAGDFERLRSDLGRISAASEHMGRLLDELLELSRVGRLTIQKERVKLDEVVEEAAGLVEGALVDRKVSLSIESGPETTLYGERPRLVALFLNLLGNAAKFMGDQKEPKITIGTRHAPAEPGGRVIFIRDNGVGIDPRHHAIIFRLFERLETSGDGTGIGLTLVQRIVESHGGRVWVESAGLGEGSTFCFTLADA
jgi:signal transduction histidine kinase